MKAYHFTLSKRDGLASAKLLSAPNKSQYLKELVRRDIDREHGEIDEVNYQAIYFEIDESHVGQNANTVLKVSELTDPDIVQRLDANPPASAYLRRLVLEDVYGPAYSQLQAMAKEAKARASKQAPDIFTVSTVITVYMPNAETAVKQLSYQSNISGYLKNLIRRDMGLPERLILPTHMSHRNFKRFDLFNDRTLMNTWEQHKFTEAKLRATIDSALTSAYALLPPPQRRHLRDTVAEFKQAQAKLNGDADMDYDDTTEKLQTTMQLIQCDQGVIRDEALKLLATSDAELYDTYIQAVEELRDLRKRLVSFNKKLNNKGVKRMPIHLRVGKNDEPEMIEWLRNKEFKVWTDIVDYDYWLHAKRNYRDGTEAEYVRQMGDCYGFYFTQLIVKDVADNDYGDRAEHMAQ